MQTQPLTLNSFYPGAKFMLLVNGIWEEINIHPNCAEELVFYVKTCFRLQPTHFKAAEGSAKRFHYLNPQEVKPAITDFHADLVKRNPFENAFNKLAGRMHTQPEEETVRNFSNN